MVSMLRLVMNIIGLGCLLMGMTLFIEMIIPTIREDLVFPVVVLIIACMLGALSDCVRKTFDDFAKSQRTNKDTHNG